MDNLTLDSRRFRGAGRGGARHPGVHDEEARRALSRATAQDNTRNAEPSLATGAPGPPGTGPELARKAWHPLWYSNPRDRHELARDRRVVTGASALSRISQCGVERTE